MRNRLRRLASSVLILAASYAGSAYGQAPSIAFDCQDQQELSINDKTATFSLAWEANLYGGRGGSYTANSIVFTLSNIATSSDSVLIDIEEPNVHTQEIVKAASLTLNSVGDGVFEGELENWRSTVNNPLQRVKITVDNEVFTTNIDLSDFYNKCNK